jgi:hypothetical protein
VNKIDIHKLLNTHDVKHANSVVSLLDSTIIDQIAEYSLAPATLMSPPRPYVSPSLTLFLSLTNLRGTPYSLNGAAPGSVEETAFFFGDRIKFQVLKSGEATPQSASAHGLDLKKAGAEGGWDLLQTAAKATGAFPVFLAPRILNRNLYEYTPPMWESVASEMEGTPPPISPTFPPDTPNPIATLNVDGGITNNDPFNYAHDFLAKLDPPRTHKSDAVTAIDTDRAVINVAPFPTIDKFDVDYDPKEHTGVFSAIGALFSALVSQSRFLGESLDQIMRGTTFDRFVIAPSDAELIEEYKGKKQKEQPAALQCAVFGAFGGFFHRGFRAHDYALGRRNCQKFLLDSFVLPKSNVIMKAALEGMDPATCQTVLDNFKRSDPGNYAEDSPLRSEEEWLPIIPLCSKTVSDEIPHIRRVKMTKAEVNQIVDGVLQRYKALILIFLSMIPSMKLRVFLRIGQPVIRFFAKKPLTDSLIKNLGDSYQD